MKKIFSILSIIMILSLSLVFLNSCGHEHTEEVLKKVDATCTKKGLTEGRKCSTCGEILVAQQEIPAKGHKEVVVPGKDATCTETGLTKGKKCSTCGEILEKQEKISMLSHRYIDGYCSLCGKEDPNINAFEKLKNYIKKKGDYQDNSFNYGYLLFLESTNSEYASYYESYVCLYYNIGDNTIEISHNSDKTSTTIKVIIDSSMSGYYEYSFTYRATEGSYLVFYGIEGFINSYTFSLIVTDADSGVPVSAFKTLAKEALKLNLLLFDIYSYEVGLGLSAKDLGFYGYR